MKILITGSEGSLMQAVIPRLLAQGHTVVGVDNLYRYGHKRGNSYEFHQVDLVNRSECNSLFTGVDYVIHAAAKIYGVGGFNKYCADILSDDTTVTGNVLQACVEHDVKKIIYISSSMVYETCVQDVDHPVTEDMVDSCPMPLTDYGVSKLVGERLCQAFQKQYGLDYTVWRPFNIITPHERAGKEQGVSHVFADFIENLKIKQLTTLPLLGSGNQIRCFTWIDDIADIIAEHSFSASTTNEAFNICNVEPITMRELAQKIYNKVKVTNNELEFVTVKDYKNDVLIRIPSVQKLLDVIGPYKFQSVDQSLDRCI